MDEKLSFILSNIVNRFRGLMTVSEIRNYLLEFVFYKYLSDKLLEEVVYFTGKPMDEYETQEKQLELYKQLLLNENTKYSLQELLNENLGYEIDPDWLFITLAERAKQGILQIDDVNMAFLSLSNNYNQFRDLFNNIDKNLRKSDASHLIYTFTEIVMELYEIGVLKNIGDTFELLIRQCALEDRKGGGESYTPREISDLMSQIVTRDRDNKLQFSVYDPAMGSGSLMVNIQKYLEHPEDAKFYGQEINTDTYNIARMNLILHGVKNENMILYNGDTLNNGWLKEEPSNFDVVLMNPPYSARWEADWRFIGDERFYNYGKLAPKSKADYAFLLHGLFHLKESGIMAIVLPHGVLFRGGAEGVIRKRLLEYGNIDSIIGLPKNIFFATAIPTVVIILKKDKMDKNVLFIDASREYIKEKSKNKLTEKGINKILEAYKKRQDIEKFAYVASFEEIIKNDYNLNIPRYVNMYSDTIVNSKRHLKDVADIITYHNALNSDGVFLTNKDLKYPLIIKEKVQNRYGIELKCGDIIVLRSGRKYLYYENKPNIYLEVNQQNILYIVRSRKIRPEVLFLYLETEEVTNYLFDMSGKSFPNIDRNILEELPIVKELPLVTAHKKNKSYISLFEEKYYIRVSISNLSSLFQSVQIKLTESTNNKQLTKEIVRLIESGEEGVYWDFKMKHHTNKARLLHDIICMANNIADREAYIIIGVEDKTGRVVGVEHDEGRKDTTHFNNILKTASFFADNIPMVNLETIIIKNHEIDVIIVEHITQRPFYLTKDYRDKEVVVSKNAIYARESDSNTDIDKSASVRAIEHLWYERFANNKS